MISKKDVFQRRSCYKNARGTFEAISALSSVTTSMFLSRTPKSKVSEDSSCRSSSTSGGLELKKIETAANALISYFLVCFVPFFCHFRIVKAAFYFS